MRKMWIPTPLKIARPTMQITTDGNRLNPYKEQIKCVIINRKLLSSELLIFVIFSDGEASPSESDGEDGVFVSMSAGQEL